MVLVPLSMLSLHSSAQSTLGSKVISNNVPNSLTIANPSDNAHETNEMLKLDAQIPMEVASKHNAGVMVMEQGLIGSKSSASKQPIYDTLSTRHAIQPRKCKYINSKEYKKSRGKWNSQATIIGTSSRCQVCGEIAGKHNYYGGRSCQSCRAFFRRSAETLAR